MIVVVGIIQAPIKFKIVLSRLERDGSFDLKSVSEIWVTQLRKFTVEELKSNF